MCRSCRSSTAGRGGGGGGFFFFSAARAGSDTPPPAPSQLEPGCTVLLHNKALAVVGVLGDDADPMVSVMKVRGGVGWGWGWG